MVRTWLGKASKAAYKDQWKPFRSFDIKHKAAERVARHVALNA